MGLNPLDPRTLLTMISIAALAAPLRAQTTPPLAKPADKAPAEKVATEKDSAKAPAGYTSADELLTALETADKQIQTLTAQLRYVTVATDAENNDKQTRDGVLYFRNREDAAPGATPPRSAVPAAATVRFDMLMVSGKLLPEHKTYIVNGPVMLERLEDEKIVNRIKRTEAEKDQDPLKLGEGPFPLPFGQRKADVLARFRAELVPFDQAAPGGPSFRARLAQTYQLKLTPKPDAGISSSVTEVRVWYEKKGLFPFIARIVHPGGAYDEFMLLGPQVNKPLPEGVFDTSIPAGWKVEEKERP